MNSTFYIATAWTCLWDKCPGLCTCPTLSLVATCPTLSLVSTCPTLSLVATCPTLSLVATCPTLLLVATYPTLSLVATCPTLSLVATCLTLSLVATCPTLSLVATCSALSLVATCPGQASMSSPALCVCQWFIHYRGKYWPVCLYIGELVSLLLSYWFSIHIYLLFFTFCCIHIRWSTLFTLLCHFIPTWR